MRYALKFGYDGTCFHGFARQPGKKTVEEDVIDSLIAIGAIKSAWEARFQKASRTDKGVSAIGNVVAFDTNFSKKNILSALNAQTADIWFYGIAAVDDDFNPRHATERWYRYLLFKNHLKSTESAKRLNEAALLFVGEHDFRSFARTEGKNPIRRIDSIEITEESAFFAVDLTARTFLWNMVRRVIAALIAYENGKTTEADIRKALRGERKNIGGIAPADCLFLMDVRYPFEFQCDEELKALQKKFDARLRQYEREKTLISAVRRASNSKRLC